MWYNLGMPNGRIISFEDANYLVTLRGGGGRDIFLDEAGRLEYLELLGRAKHGFSLLLPAYALMPGLVQLYIVTPKANLSEALRWLDGEYSGYFSRARPGAGRPFEERYKCKLIQGCKYALPLARYLHVTPVKAGLAAKPESYRWSSAAQYLGLADGPADKGLVLDGLGNDPAAALAKYIEFMSEPIPGKFWRPFDKNRDAVLGDPVFRAAHSPHKN